MARAEEQGFPATLWWERKPSLGGKYSECDRERNGLPSARQEALSPQVLWQLPVHLSTLTSGPCTMPQTPNL